MAFLFGVKVGFFDCLLIQSDWSILSLSTLIRAFLQRGVSAASPAPLATPSPSTQTPSQRQWSAARRVHSQADTEKQELHYNEARKLYLQVCVCAYL